MVAGCGDDAPAGPTCGANTMLVDGMCVAEPSTACGSGTMLENGVCVPTPITPTTCGPGTTMVGTECVADPTAPGPVSALTAAVSGGSINLSWTAGASSAKTLVVRTIAGTYDAPAIGVSYTAGMTLPGGSTVVYAGTGTTASHTFTTPGRYSYMAWAQNASGNYGFARETSVVATVPTQVGQITLDVANATATVTAQPAHTALAVAGFTYDVNTSLATFDLSATNQTAGHRFNPKAIVRSLSVGTVASPAGQADNGDPFVRLGVAAQLPGAASTASVMISGVGATDTVTIGVEIIESGLALAGENVIDAYGGNAFPLDILELAGNRQGPRLHDGFPSASGRYFYVTTRWHPTLFRIDTNTGAIESVSPFASGNAGCVVFGPDGYAYSGYQLVTHRAQWGNRLGIAKIDPISLAVIARAEIENGTESIAKGCAIAGNRFAVSYGPSVFVADTTTMAFVDAVPSTADVIDPVAVSATDPIRTIVPTPAGTKLYATAQKNDLAIYAIDPMTLAVSTYHTASSSQVRSLTVDAAGKLWWGASSGVYSFDGNSQAAVPNYSLDTGVIAAVEGTKAFVINLNGAPGVIDLSDGSITRMGSGSNNKLGHHATYFAVP